MKKTVNEIYHYLDDLYPFETQMSFDNAGFLVGDRNAIVSKILVALDVTTAVIEEAIKKGCQLIITHHPLIFTPLKRVLAENPTEKMVMSLIKHDISLISAHTNLDRAAEGVNFHLAKALALENISFVLEEGIDKKGRTYGTGFFGTADVKNLSVAAYGKVVAEKLNSKALRFTDAGKPVVNVAVGGGSCSSLLSDVIAQGCDTYVTGDVKYDVFLDAKEKGINLIDAGHYPTEQVVCRPVVDKLKEQFPLIEVFLSEVHEDVCQSLNQ
ncbi:MAG: Nif3-like dinuclear metal center hexameric protein [Eubacteriales bacterium]